MILQWIMIGDVHVTQQNWVRTSASGSNTYLQLLEHVLTPLEYGRTPF